MCERVIDGRVLESAVSHAVVACGIAANAVAVPLRVLHQRAEGRRVALVRQQVTGPLPTEDVVGRGAPGRALVRLVAGEEVEEQARVIERPATATAVMTPSAALEDLAKQPLAGAPAEKD